MSITTRDYKKAPRRTLDAGRFREFGAGMLVGVVLASAVFIYMEDSRVELAETPRPEARRAEPQAENAAPAENGEEYDFYEMLPKFEVIVPEKEPDVKRDLPAARIERPGVYVLQAGSYRNLADAERAQRQLALQGIQAKIQRVSVDSDVWHRVRIGPISDLAELNRLRQQLQAAEVDGLVIRVGD